MTEASRDRAAGTDEDGFVLVWFALIITLLLAVGAFTVDILHGYSAAQEAQNAADAAALAGVVQMPEFAPDASNTAIRVGQENISGATITPAQTAFQNQLQVTVRKQIDTFFARIIGIDKLTVNRSAIAEYDPPIQMGSPTNSFGNLAGVGCAPADPTCPRFWATVSGGLTAKQGGNAAMAAYCDEDHDVPAYGPTTATANPPLGLYDDADNCQYQSGPDTHTNFDYEATGPGGSFASQYFVVAVRPGVGNGGPLQVELFDPAHVALFGRNCADDDELVREWNATHLAHLDPIVQDLCTNDSIVRYENWELDFPNVNPTQADDDAGEISVTTRGISVDTTFELFPPDNTRQNPYDNELNNPAVCSQTYQGFADVDHAMFDVPTWSQYFRKWTTLPCTLPPTAAPGDQFVLKVTTPRNQEGNNNFGIAANTNAGPRFGDTDVSVYAVDRMAIYTNDRDPNGEFYLARVLPSTTDRTLRVSLFDSGDFVGSGNVDITVFPSGVTKRSDGAAMTELPDCAVSAPGTSTFSQLSPWENNAPAWGTPATVPGPACTFSTARATHNGQWITIEIPISSDYNCVTSNPLACWLKISFAGPAGSWITDISTWSASFNGNPVRIIQ